MLSSLKYQQRRPCFSISDVRVLFLCQDLCFERFGSTFCCFSADAEICSASEFQIKLGCTLCSTKRRVLGPLSSLRFSRSNSGFQDQDSPNQGCSMTPKVMSFAVQVHGGRCNPYHVSSWFIMVHHVSQSQMIRSSQSQLCSRRLPGISCLYPMGLGLAP